MNELDVLRDDGFKSAMQVAHSLAKSSIIPAHFRGKPEDVFATIAMGAELGFRPMQALNSIVMISGNATLKAQTMLAIARGKIPDLIVRIEERGDEVTVTVERGNNKFTSVWNDAKASAMGLLGKDNYKKQKLTMFRWRAISEALKITCSDVLMGVYSTEEMQDIEVSDYKKSDPVDVTPASHEQLDLLFSKLDKIKDGEARLIKHTNDKYKTSINVAEEMNSDQIEYALGFLKQFEKKEKEE